MRGEPIQKILAAQEPEGYWARPGSGYWPSYRSTAWQILFLAELGASGHNRHVQRGCEYLLKHAQAIHGGLSMLPNGAPRGAMHCHHGNLTWALIALGYGDDERIGRTIDWLGGFIFIALSLIIMALTRRPWREYGLTLKDWRLSCDVGLTGYVACFVTMGALFALVLLGENYRWSWPGSVVLLIAGIAGVWLLLTMLKRQDATDPSGDARRSKARNNLIVLGGLIHATQTFNPLLGQYDFAWPCAVYN